MKKYNALKIVGLTLAVFLLLTWILPAAVYQTSYTEIGRSQMGIFDIVSYQGTVLGYFGYVALFVLVVGGFYGVLYKIGAYRKLLDKLVARFKNREAIFISIVVILFAFLTSFCGVQLALIAFFPFIISLLLMMGFSKLASVAATAGSVAIGLMGTTFAYSTVQVLNQYLGIELSNNIIVKIIILVLGIALLILSILLLSKKATRKEEKDKNEFIPATVKGAKVKRVWPLIVTLDVIALIIILSFISWTGTFNVDIFTNATNAVTEFELFGFPIFSKILGTFSAFGNWTLTEITTLLLIAIVALKFIYKIKWDDVISGFGTGLKKAIIPAVIVLIIYTCLVLTTYNPFQLFIYNALLNMTKGFNVFTTSLVVVLSSLFNGDPLYAFYSVIPYFISVVTDSSVYGLVAVIFQSIYGVVTLIAPTSIPLMITLAYLKVPYQNWFKYIWKLLLALIVVLFIIFTILLLI